MKSFVSVNFVVFVLALFAVTKGYSDEEFQYSPSRRSKFGSQGLFSKPRIGRSDPTLMNNMHQTEAWLDDLYATLYDDDVEDFPRNEIKRTSYINLPRVGRSDPEVQKFAYWLQQTLDKRAAKPYAGVRMFDNPRTGKRSADAYAQKVEVAAKALGQKEEI